MNNTALFYPKNKTAWREWLENNHLSKEAVWLVFHSKKSKKDSISWSEAVDIALCFGWIDSKKIKIDSETSHQFFSKRKPKSTWSKINKEKIKNLIENKLMSEAGFNSIEVAKQNGYWSILDEVEELIIPKDLQEEFDNNKESETYFLSLSKSSKKMMLQWLVLAKKTETRNKRIFEIIENAKLKQKPKAIG